MNAFAPKATLLIKLAQLLLWVSNSLEGIDRKAQIESLLDSEVLEWYDRMADLEYVPKRALVTIIPEGQTAALSLLDAEQDRIECGAVISEAPRQLLQGYQLCAEDGSGTNHATYREAATQEIAFQQCLEEFDPDDGFRNHSVVGMMGSFRAQPEPPALALD